MTPTKDDALAALEWFNGIIDVFHSRYEATEPEKEIKHINIIKQALTQPRETVSTTMDYDLIAPVAHYFNGDADKTEAWFETPNPNLGGVKPIDTPQDRLLKFITEQTSSQPPVDVEALKIDAREAVYHRQKNIAEPDVVQDIVWDCIDYLVSKGCLK